MKADLILSTVLLGTNWRFIGKKTFPFQMLWAVMIPVLLFPSDTGIGAQSTFNFGTKS